MVAQTVKPLLITKAAREKVHELADDLNRNVGDVVELIAGLDFRLSSPLAGEAMFLRWHPRSADLVIAISDETRARLGAIGKACGVPAEKPVRSIEAETLDAILNGLLIPEDAEDLHEALHEHRRDPLEGIPDRGFVKVKSYISAEAGRTIRKLASGNRKRPMGLRRSVEILGEALWNPEMDSEAAASDAPMWDNDVRRRYPHQMTLSVVTARKFGRLAERFHLTKRAAYRSPGGLIGAALEAVGTGRILLNAEVRD